MPLLFTSEDVGDGARLILEDKAKDEKDIVVSKLLRPGNIKICHPPLLMWL